MSLAESSLWLMAILGTAYLYSDQDFLCEEMIYLPY